MSDGQVKVLYIAGWGRSGSTIIGNILGQIDGYFDAGEMCYLWDRGLLQNRLCGCQRSLCDCSTWRAVLARTFDAGEPVDPAALLRLQKSTARTRHIPLLATAGGRRLLEPHLSTYVAVLGRLYSSISAETGASVIVDSSKEPAYGYLLGLSRLIDLHIVHLVRDPRAVAFSWQRKKFDPSHGRPLDRLGLGKSSSTWLAWNMAIELLWRRNAVPYLRLRYEDFMQRPQASIAAMLSLLGMDDRQLPFLDGRTVNLAASHTISGNPLRFDRGPVRLTADHEWSLRMPARKKLLVTLLTWPLLARYGYGARGGTL